ncbi:MAG: DUF2892 domain-containing protein [Candidatus Zixiibacteriota bacterium]
MGMIVNVGKVDRILRAGVGGAAVTLAVVLQNWIGLLGLYPLFTGLFGSCSVYRVLGIDTLSGSNEKDFSDNHNRDESA